MTVTQSPVQPVRPPGNHRRAMREDSLSFLLENTRAHGPHLALDLDRPTLVLADPADIKHVLAKNPLNYNKAGIDVEFTGVFGHSLVNFEGSQHRCARKSFAPHFQKRALTTVPDVVAEFVGRAIDEWQPGEVNLIERMTHLMVAISAKLTLGLGPEDEQRYTTYAYLIRKIYHAMVERLHMPVALPRWLPVRPHRRERRFTNELREAALALINERRNERAADDGDDLLTLMLSWQRERPEEVPDDWIIHQMMSLMLATYETVAHTVTWAIAHVSQHRSIEQQVLDNCEQVLAGRAPTFDDLPQLDIIQRVLCETERLTPFAWLLARTTVDRDVLPSGIEVESGMRILISIPSVHQREDIYPEPMRFDPDRFTMENLRARPQYSFIPFGGGPRVCLGEHLAQIMGATALAMIIPRLRFQLIGPMPHLISQNGYTTQPSDCRVMVRVERR